MCLYLLNLKRFFFNIFNKKQSEFLPVRTNVAFYKVLELYLYECTASLSI